MAQHRQACCCGLSGAVPTEGSPETVWQGTKPKNHPRSGPAPAQPGRVSARVVVFADKRHRLAAEMSTLEVPCPSPAQKPLQTTSCWTYWSGARPVPRTGLARLLGLFRTGSRTQMCYANRKIVEKEGKPCRTQISPHRARRNPTRTIRDWRILADDSQLANSKFGKDCVFFPLLVAVIR